MTRRFWVPATALFLSSIMAMIGSVSQDAMVGIVALSESTGASIVQEEGPTVIQSAADFAPVSARYWMRGIVLLLIYRTFTGWKPMIS